MQISWKPYKDYIYDLFSKGLGSIVQMRENGAKAVASMLDL